MKGLKRDTAGGDNPATQPAVRPDARPVLPFREGTPPMYRVTIDPDLADLVPGYLANRRADLDHIGAALAASDFATVRRLGHSMRGTGGGYGFDEITRLGGLIEDAAMATDADAVRALLSELAHYLAAVEVDYGAAPTVPDGRG
jgi:HPt (histidine-containing phosphotransfer) domain-containing protein